MFIGGYSAGHFFSEQFVGLLPFASAPTPVFPDASGKPHFGASWYGQTDVLTRIVRGYANDTMRALEKMGVPTTTLQDCMNTAPAHLPIIFDGMPLQDAIDLADYLTSAVIGSQRFCAGPAGCGGPVDIAVIRPANFAWARHKAWPPGE